MMLFYEKMNELMMIGNKKALEVEQTNFKSL